MSRDAGLPDARQLAEWRADDAPITELPRVAALFPVVDAVDPTGMPADVLQRVVAAHIGSFPLRPTRLLNEPVHLPSRFIITFNYDLLGVAA